MSRFKLAFTALAGLCTAVFAVAAAASPELNLYSARKEALMQPLLDELNSKAVMLSLVLYPYIYLLARAETEPGIIQGKLPDSCKSDSQIEVLLRPDDVLHENDSETKLEVTAKAFRGAEYLYSLALPGGQTILCLVQSHHNHRIGERICIKLAVDDLAVFPADYP